MDTSRLEQLIEDVRETTEGDSNDEEIQALRAALSEALSLLGVNQ